MQRQEERIALKNWQKLWSTNTRGGSGGDDKEVREVATNYLRRGNHNDFLEKIIAAKHLAREKERTLKEERAKIRAEKRKAKEVESREREVEENYKEKLSNALESRERKKNVREVKKRERQYLRDNEIQIEREERRRLRIEELKSAQV